MFIDGMNHPSVCVLAIFLVETLSVNCVQIFSALEDYFIINYKSNRVN